MNFLRLTVYADELPSDVSIRLQFHDGPDLFLSLLSLPGVFSFSPFSVLGQIVAFPCIVKDVQLQQNGRFIPLAFRPRRKLRPLYVFSSLPLFHSLLYITQSPDQVMVAVLFV